MRLKDIDRENLEPAQQAVLQAIEQGPRGKGRPGIGLIGPFGAWVRAPEIGGAVQALGSAIRFDGCLAENIKEVAICTVGAYYKSKFEFAAHQNLALRAGVSQASLDALVCGDDPDFAGGELIAHTVASQLVHQHTILDETYETGVATFGEKGMIELVATVGYYCLISLTLNAFNIPLEPGMSDPFPDTDNQESL